MADAVMTSSATGAEIEAILKRVLPVVESDPTHHVIISALFLAAIASAPGLTFDEMQRTVEATSQFMVLFLTQIEEERRQAASEAVEPDLSEFKPTIVN